MQKRQFYGSSLHNSRGLFGDSERRLTKVRSNFLMQKTHALMTNGLVFWLLPEVGDALDRIFLGAIESAESFAAAAATCGGSRQSVD